MTFLTRVKIIDARSYRALEEGLNEFIKEKDVIDIKYPNSLMYTAAVHYHYYKNKPPNMSMRVDNRSVESAE